MATKKVVGIPENVGEMPTPPVPPKGPDWNDWAGIMHQLLSGVDPAPFPGQKTEDIFELIRSVYDPPGWRTK
jgi:hypothetical protein